MNSHGTDHNTSLPKVVKNCSAATVVPVDVGTISVSQICARESANKFCCSVAAVLRKILRAGFLGLVGVLVCVYPRPHSMEEEVVGGESLGVGLPDRAKMLTQ